MNRLACNGVTDATHFWIQHAKVQRALWVMQQHVLWVLQPHVLWVLQQRALWVLEQYVSCLKVRCALLEGPCLQVLEG
jgi:hypothetical protein